MTANSPRSCGAADLPSAFEPVSRDQNAQVDPAVGAVVPVECASGRLGGASCMTTSSEVVFGVVSGGSLPCCFSSAGAGVALDQKGNLWG